MLIDTHIHTGIFHHNNFSPEYVASLMDVIGVDYYAVSSTTICIENYDLVLDEINTLQQLHKERVLPIMWITPEGLRGNVWRLIDSKIRWRCLKVHPYLNPDAWDSSGKCFVEVLAIARELCLPILIHTGNDSSCCSQRFESLFESNKDVIFILAHGRPIDQALKAIRLENVYSDSAFMPISDIQKIITSGLSDKLLWGTDMCIPKHFYPNIKLQTYYKSKLDELKKVSTQKQYEKITCWNARQVFNI